MLPAFRTILVALDGHEGGLDAAALGARLTTAESELALAHVLTRAARAISAGEARDAAIAVMRRHDAGLDPVLITTRTGSVVAGLREVVEARGSDLLVVGAHHHRHLNVASHDHTRDALRQLSCAIAVAPWHYAARPPAAIGSVGVGYVDDRGGRVVLDAARGLAWQFGVELRATMAVPRSNWPDEESDTGWRAISAARRLTEIPGIRGTAVEGDPYHALLELSREVDLLVVGTHHRGALRRLLPHDTTDDLSLRAACPLVVVPHDA